MYIKQIISVHPRSSCTIFCAKCGTALLKIRPFEGFAPQLYPENPKMRYSSTQAPASPSALAPASPSTTSPASLSSQASAVSPSVTAPTAPSGGAPSLR